MKMSPDYAYLLGCLNGDAWIHHTGPPGSRHAIGMNAKDLEFVQEFAAALIGVLGKASKVRQFNFPYGPQWRTIAHSAPFVHELEQIKTADLAGLLGPCYPKFLRGMYDSEGSFYVRQRGPTSVQPVYRMWSTDKPILILCQQQLRGLCINTNLFLASPKGTKTVGETVRLKDLYCLRWQGHTSSRIWESTIGSSIPRKRYVGPGPSPIRCPRKYRYPAKLRETSD